MSWDLFLGHLPVPLWLPGKRGILPVLAPPRWTRAQLPPGDTCPGRIHSRLPRWHAAKVVPLMG